MSDYLVISFFSKEDNCYLSVVPELPGCMADGKNLDVLHHNTEVIIQEWIETCEELGRPVPPRSIRHLESTNPNIYDVAEYILSKTGTITTMMLEKLTYYCLAWSLGWYKEPMFQQQFRAFKNGPVCSELFNRHKGMMFISPGQLKDDRHSFSAGELLIIDSVLLAYGNKDAEWLSDLTHSEQPWNNARRGLRPEENGNVIISNEDMINCYQ